MYFIRFLSKGINTFKKGRVFAATVLALAEEKKRLEPVTEECSLSPTMMALKTAKTNKPYEAKEPKAAGPDTKPVKKSSGPGKPCSSPGVYKPCERECVKKEVEQEVKCVDDLKDKASEQLNEFRKAHTTPVGNVTTGSGAPLGVNAKTTSLSTGTTGYILLQDSVLLEELAHFNRERIPERVVSAKGAGAFGQFEVTEDFSKYCKTTIFNKGKKTQVAVRFSSFGSENGTADTERDIRGFSIKFYSEDGVWDLVGANTPVFFIQDPMNLPSLVHAMRRNPVTHLKDADMFWDYITLRPETVHQILFLFSDRGLPDGYRHMNGYGIHAYKLTNKNGECFFCKFHLKTNQGIRNLTPDQALFLASMESDYCTRDLFNAIGEKRYPSWTLCAQIIPECEALELAKTANNLFDATKVWSQKTYPLINIGKLTLNRNPKSYFSEVEQLAYSPANLVQGIDVSPDKLLQGRIFAYSDSQRYRLGPNYQQLCANSNPCLKTKTYQRDGDNFVDLTEGGPNFFPNSYNGPVEKPGIQESCNVIPETTTSRHVLKEEDHFSQAKVFYKEVLKDEEQKNLAKNIACHLQRAHSCLQDKVLALFQQVDEQLHKDIATYLAEYQAAIYETEGQ
uniref:Catalase core domain-containing protein n=1 Tax=Biomphalaria glabrata TaxID=6526 RepID=A0A2C9JBD1_BIOGL